MPGPHTDHEVARAAGRGEYDELLQAGVRIYEYQQTLIHAKVVTVDGVIATVGSANLNHRSLLKDEETNLVMIDQSIARILDEHFEQDREASIAIQPCRWKRRHWWLKLRQWLALRLRHEL